MSTYIGVESPEKRCGKTTLLGVLSELVNRPVVAANISSPAFFRVIEETRPTLLIDEADTWLQGNDQLRGILNSGYSRKTAYVVRVQSEKFKVQSQPSPLAPLPSDGRGEPEDSGEVEPLSPALSPSDGERKGTSRGGAQRTDAPYHSGSKLARFSSWCPKVMAAIGRLPETLADRCIVIRMERKLAQEVCERLRSLDGAALRERCALWVGEHAEEIAGARPEIPKELNDRAADIWEPLLAVADLAGGEWPEKARQAAVGLTAKAQEHNPIASLLLDILYLFVTLKAERVFSRDLVIGLNRSTFRERPWREMVKGKEITEIWLSRQLRPYGVRPRTIWIGEESAKGYVKEDFGEVWPRYVPREEAKAFIAERKGGGKKAVESRSDVAA